MIPELEQAKEIAKNPEIRSIPLRKELLADFTTPIEVMRRMKARSEHCFLLESALNNGQRGRYTFLGFNPLMELTCLDHLFTIKDLENKTSETFHTDNPNKVLEKILEENKSVQLEGFPPFSGGLAGYFAYEYQHYAEPTLHFHPDRHFADLDLMLFRDLIVFDDFTQKILLITNVVADHLEEQYPKAQKRLDDLEALIKSDDLYAFEPLVLHEKLKLEKSKESFCSMVSKARDYIAIGDIFQAVLSNPLQAQASGSLFDTYRILRTENPSPYMFYFTSGHLELAGASPETLVSLNQGVVQTFPLAGTRARGKTLDEDLALEKELLADEKELAEHNMLVDLGRNDIGKVAETGSVEVLDYLKVRRYSSVMHISSIVQGKLKEQYGPLDALAAVLPAGTLSGAPKYRASQIIYELEGNERGVYGGSVGYLDFAGNMDMCIAIRLAVKKDDQLTIRSGAGIVDDSIAENEYQECAHKAFAVKKSIEKAQGLQTC